MKLVTQSLIIIFSFAAVYVWQQIGFFVYTVPIIGFLIFMYLFLLGRKKNKKMFNLDGNSVWTIWLLNTLVLLLIFSTGSITSPIFFLLYFLGFGIAFVFEPVVVLVFLVCAIALFLPDSLKDDVNGNLLRLGSLLLITPLAYFFGNEFKGSNKKEEEIEKITERAKDAADNISGNVEEIIKNEKENLSNKTTNKLNEILEETEDLREETKEKSEN